VVQWIKLDQLHHNLKQILNAFSIAKFIYKLVFIYSKVVEPDLKLCSE